MAKCKECVHGDVCFTVLDSMQCQHFKDRSRFVELPYKLGDVVYFIFERKVIGGVVRRISFDNTKLGAKITLDSLDDNDYGTIYGLLADDDCEIFLSREEAEKTLKEKEHEEL